MKEKSLIHLKDAIERKPALEKNYAEMLLASEAIIESYKKGGKLLLCGNGGSMSDSLHFTSELLNAFKLKRKIDDEAFIEKLNDDKLCLMLEKSIPSITLGSDLSFLSSYSNDRDYDYAFAQQLYSLAKENDILIAFSTSGSSSNVVNAVKVAKALGIKIIAFTGEKVAPVNEMADIKLMGSSTEAYEIQELHLPMYHAIALAVEEELFGE